MRSNTRVGMVISIGFITMFFSAAVKNVYQINFSNISSYFNVSHSALSVSASIFMLLMGVGSYISGVLADKIGPRKTIIIGTWLLSLVFILCAYANSFLLFTLAYGIGAPISLAFIQFIPMVVLVDKYVKKFKGFSLALLSNGTALGFAILSPLWIYLSVGFSWKVAFFAVGTIFLFITLFIITCFSKENHDTNSPTEVQPIGFKQIFSDKIFWFLSLSFFGCGTSMAFIDVHLVPFLEDISISKPVLATSLSVLGITEIIGGLVAGVLADKVNTRYLLSLYYFIRFISLLVLLYIHSNIGIIIFSFIFGFTYLGTVIISSLICLNNYGKSKGRVFGIVFVIHQIGCSLIVLLGGYLRDLLGGYLPIIVIILLITLMSSVLSLFIKVNRSYD